MRSLLRCGNDEHVLTERGGCFGFLEMSLARGVHLGRWCLFEGLMSRAWFD